MNSLIFCAILSLSSSLAFKVSFHRVDHIKFVHIPVPVLVCTTHQFIYHRGDAFTMYLQLANNSTKAVAVVKNESGDTYLTRAFWPEGKPINFHPKFDKITIDVELTENGTCVRERILEGREALTAGTNMMAFKYNDICLKENHCLVLLDPTRECTGQKLTPLPCENGRYVEVVAPADDQYSRAATDTNKKKKRSKSIPDNSRAKDESKEGAENTYFIIMIVTSITSAVALILLLVIAFRQRCWIKYNPPGIPQIVPTNPNPFYENVLFRAECQRDIEEQEQREYDVVPAENEYEEIFNHSTTNARFLKNS